VRDDGQRWDERYRATSEVHAVHPEVVDFWPDVASLLPSTGRAVDVASGPGSVTLWLAQRGLEVIALDVSAVAIELLRSAAVDLDLADRIDARVVDLDDGLPVDAADCDLIVCQRFHDPAIAPIMIDRLRVGGYAAVTVLSTVGTQHTGRFHAPPGALRNEFGAETRCEVLREHEGNGIAHIIVRRR
jgi:SAM-dependent methyltransferase